MKKRCLKRQHADEVHGPHATCQAECAQRFPYASASGGIHMDDSVGDVQRGKARRTRHAIGQRHQKQIMTAVDQQLTIRWQASEHVQTQPLHSVPYFDYQGARLKAWRFELSVGVVYNLPLK